MGSIFSRVLENLVGRVHGPMRFRLIVQPLVAVILAIRDGKKDAREGIPPYFWSLCVDRGRRGELIRRGAESVGRVFIAAIVVDAIYQVWVLRTFYPGEALLVSFILAILPYLVLRGPANRLMSRKYMKGKP